MKETVLVTGSQGFIGHHICDELLTQGYSVIGVDNMSKYKDVKRSHDLHSGFNFHKLDLRGEENDLLDMLQFYNVSYIIHAAARIGGIELFHSVPFDLIRDNAIIDSNVVDVAITYKNVKRFVALSSSMVYENTNIYPTSEDCLDKIPPPSSSYGFSKLSLEYKVKAAHDQYKLPYTIIRPFNAVGIGEEDFLEGKKSHVIPDLIMKCINNDGFKPLEILGGGNQVRCYTSAKDIARGIVLAMTHKFALNNDFNISTPVATTVGELAARIWNKIHPQKPLFITCTQPFKYDVQKRIPDVTKAKALLDFEAKISLDESLDEVIAYMKANTKLLPRS